MAAASGRAQRAVERLGRSTVAGVEGFGFGAALFAESVYWLFAGRARRQPVRVAAVFQQMMQTGVLALPIVTVLSVTIGVMLAIQGIHTLRLFGAESRVTVGIALSMTREFAPLITGILVAGRTQVDPSTPLDDVEIDVEFDEPA